MDYAKTSKDILAAAGGAENISSYTNCMTRLRLNVKDQSKVDVEAIKAMDGVMGVIPGEQTQVVVGPGHAERLRQAFGEVSGVTADPEIGGAPTADPSQVQVKDKAAETKAAVKAKQTSKAQKLFRHVGNIFIPIIPGFIACGLVLAITNIIKMADPSVAKNPWFLVAAGLGGLITSGLNLAVGYNTAKEFGGTPILGLLAGGVPYMTSLAGIAATDTTPAQPITIPLFGELHPALGGVIGVMLTAFIFTVIEKNFRKIVPASLDLFLVPFVTLVVGSAICIFIIMPLSGLLMQGINWLLIDFALEKGGVFGGYLLSALFLPLVMLGIHQGLTPIHAQLIADHGFTQLLPVLAMAGAGQVGMALAVWAKTKNKELKNIIKSALPIGFLGIGEPLIYGVSLPLFYPFITACLGAGFGGAVVALGIQLTPGGFGSTGLGVSGILMTGLISGGQWLWYVGGLLTAYVMGFILTYFFGFKEKMVERLA
ncbi:MAG: PTS transporter subunit EIIC [Propionibacteriaceae bacterium]|jgi:PTS system sucrose-specific IIC component|nr:PTS transporter subunit EIIC [Propionibacteriaceae bacterium]